MPQHVSSGQPLNLSATDYNRMLDAADAHAQGKLHGSSDPSARTIDAAIVRVHNTTGELIPAGGSMAIDAVIPDPTIDAFSVADFVRDMTAKVVTPTIKNPGQFAVALEPIEIDAVGRAVIDGIAAARVNITDAWHTMADINVGTVNHLRSAPAGAADILYRIDPDATGVQWCVVRVGNTIPVAFFVQPPTGGIPGLVDTTPGFAPDCTLYRLIPQGNIEKVKTPDGDDVKITALNRNPQLIAEPPDDETLQLVPARFDARTSRWIADAQRQVTLSIAMETINPGDTGTCNELRFVAGSWTAKGPTILVLNACSYSIKSGDQVLGHFHADLNGYVGQVCKCCDDSESDDCSG